MKALYEVKNEYYGIAAHVNQLANGSYSVTLFDTEARETVPAGYIYKDLSQAKAKADKLVEQY